MSGGLSDRLRARIEAGRVLDDATTITKYAADASAYLLRPRVVVLAASVADIQASFEVARETGVPLAFRAAGTSLSGQSQTDGILVEAQRHWRGITVLDDGARVRLRPGTVGAVVNGALSRYGAEIGPDPASISACTIGGIVANNSSGMCCGVDRNAYHTLDSLTFVLTDGTVVDTAAPDAEATFAAAAPELASGLLDLRREVLADEQLRAEIERKYRLKNTTGYGLNAFLDFETPLGIFSHLLVGSEGTLAFIAEVVLRTVPVEPHRRTALLLYPDLVAACAAVGALAGSGARAIELMDGPALLSAADDLGPLAASVDRDTTGLLVEWRAETALQLDAMMPQAEAVVAAQPLLAPAPLHADPALAAQLWAVRKGMLATVGGARPAGSSIILEDVVFPPEALAEGTADLHRLLADHGYDGVIFGHAKDGNLHFLISEDFGRPDAAQSYARFMADLAALVLRHRGALKGEHGTGRNMAPFVADEWGGHAADLMAKLKRLADPDAILNPGTIVAISPTSHVEHLKATPIADPEIDRCVECGFCERGCPSGDLTTTPRQRIVIRRELARLRAQSPASPAIAELEAALGYQVVDTCAADGMCQLACPVGINTGDLVKRLRGERHGPGAARMAETAARRWEFAERAARAGLRAAETASRAVGADRVRRTTARVNQRFAGLDLAPAWIEGTPGPAPAALPDTTEAGAAAVYFPACVNRIFASPGDLSVPEAFTRIAARAGVPVWIPDDVIGACCATPWVSKGYDAGAATMAQLMLRRAWRWTDAGRLPIVTDASSCAHGLRELGSRLHGVDKERFARLRFLDSVDFVADLLDRLAIDPVERVVVHPTCANHRDASATGLLRIAGALARSVEVPAPATCCGFGGDRGFLHPELTESATRPLAAQVESGRDGYLSANRPCEIAMSHATGEAYESFLLLLERRTRG